MSTKGKWRDTTAAQLARLEPEKVAERVKIASKMLRDGAKHNAIKVATKEATGTAIGGGTLKRLRDEMKREAKKAERVKSRAEAKLTPPPQEPLPEWVRLPPDAAIVSAFLQAGVPFWSDGHQIEPKRGGGR